MKKILIVEDDGNIRELLRLYLEREGYEITEASNGEEGVEQWRKVNPDMILLDVMMPIMDGWQVCKIIREESKVPIIILTAKGETFDKVNGLEMGADDYLVKPFLPKELLLRVEAIMKRVYPEENRLLKLEHVVVDLDRAVVLRGDETISLTAKEFGILTKLAENAGKIVTVGVLCQNACGEVWQGYEATLMTHIRHLREKIEENPSNPVSLLTVKGLGYKLMVKR